VKTSGRESSEKRRNGNSNQNKNKKNFENFLLSFRESIASSGKTAGFYCGYKTNKVKSNDFFYIPKEKYIAHNNRREKLELSHLTITIFSSWISGFFNKINNPGKNFLIEDDKKRSD